MKKLCFIIPVMIISVMFLGCLGGKKEEAAVETTIPETVTEEKVTGAIQSVDNGEPVEKTTLSEIERNTVLPLPSDGYEFTFSSGAGGWSTVLYLNSDGTFSGEYHDSEMGSTGPEYPNGTMYICTFSGYFENITKKSDYSYEMILGELEMNQVPGEEWIEDDIKYIASTPYGIEGGEGFVFGTPETPLYILGDDFLSWWPGRFDENYRDTLGCYGILNENTGEGFFSYY